MAIPDVGIGAIIGGIGGIANIVIGLTKKKPFVLWYRSLYGTPPAWKWAKKAGPFSARQCRKTMNALIKAGGFEADRFGIFRAGVDPNI